MKNKQIIKLILREGVNTNQVNKISIFDFDNTISSTPTPESGIKLYKEKTGQDWPYKGWWGRKESLDMDIFDIPPKMDVISSYKEERSKNNTLVVLLTGRIKKLSADVEKILSHYGLDFDEYHYSDSSSTLDFKLKTIEELINRYPDASEIEMWDDRDSHIPSFESFGDNLIKLGRIKHFKVNHVK
jgi:hypothetical protein